MVALGMALTTIGALPEPTVLESALREVGVETVPSDAGDPATAVFELAPATGRADGAALLVAFMPAPHPELDGLLPGPMSPPVDELAQTTSHIAVVLQGVDDPGAADHLLLRALTAIATATGAAAARVGGGANYLRVDVLRHVVEVLSTDELPPSMFVIGLTAATEGDERMSFLTHGLDRYGREEFLVTAPIDGTGAVDFVWMMADWMRNDPSKQLPTGDTVGRTADERIEVQRVANPSGDGSTVVRLDLPA